MIPCWVPSNCIYWRTDICLFLMCVPKISCKIYQQLDSIQKCLDKLSNTSEFIFHSGDNVNMFSPVLQPYNYLWIVSTIFIVWNICGICLSVFHVVCYIRIIQKIEHLNAIDKLYFSITRNNISNEFLGDSVISKPLKRSSSCSNCELLKCYDKIMGKKNIQCKIMPCSPCLTLGLVSLHSSYNILHCLTLERRFCWFDQNWHFLFQICKYCMFISFGKLCKFLILHRIWLLI